MSSIAPLFTPKMLKSRIARVALAFRGYNTTNLGKSRELLQHPLYGSVVQKVLREASELCSDTIGRPVNLSERIECEAPSTLASFPEDVALIVGMELAQVELLRDFFDVPLESARMAYGYSIGELSALVTAGVFQMSEILPVPLTYAEDCAALAHDVSMGVLFTRGPMLQFSEVVKLCLKITQRGEGVLAPSTLLAPNAAILLGQGQTIDVFRQEMRENLTDKLVLRKNPHQWPPMHTPILWQKNISNRCAMTLQQITGGFKAPKPVILSCVTGKADYNDYNSREILTSWIDKPQLLWPVIQETLAADVQAVIHIGPEPNLIPSTFDRLTTNIQQQLGQWFYGGLGHRMISNLARRSWLSQLLSKNSVLLRAPFVHHIILEDWLLQHAPTTTQISVPALSAPATASMTVATAS